MNNSMTNNISNIFDSYITSINFFNFDNLLLTFILPYKKPSYSTYCIIRLVHVLESTSIVIVLENNTLLVNDKSILKE